MKRLRIAIDIDDTIVEFIRPFEQLIGKSFKEIPDYKITQKVVANRYNKHFWSNLPLLEKPDFVPEVYCTKRLSSKIYTKANFIKLGLPIRPIYQVVNQFSNKARYIRGVADILIDDSYRNVIQCINVGFPALLITREHNKHINTPYRVNNLKYSEIENKYNELFR